MGVEMKGGVLLQALAAVCLSLALVWARGQLEASAAAAGNRAPLVAISTSGAALLPGGPPAVETATVGTASSSTVRLFVRSIVSRAASSLPVCTAPDPASRLRVRAQAGGRVVFEGTLPELARSHGSMATSLALPSGARTVEFFLSLDPGADDAYMGCASRVSLSWFQA